MKPSEPLPAEVRQSRIRSYVNEHEFVRVSDISERFGISEVTARADLTALEDRGFVIRKRSSVDRRRQDLYLTPAGQSILKKCKARIAEHDEKFRALFTSSELASLVDALKRFQSLG